MTTRSWTIEVCLTCDRLAQWPFCEHRPQVFTGQTKTWTETVTVYSRAKRPAPRCRAGNELHLHGHACSPICEYPSG